MGGFQAVASGLGETAEQAGQGYNQAVNEGLRLAQFQHGVQMDTAHLALATAAQKQTYDLAQQQHELMRQSMLEAGWVHSGTVLGPDGSYYQAFTNPRTGESKQLPYNGTPPDSPQGLMNYYRSLASLKGDNGKPMFTDLQAKQVAFKMPQLYREGPVGMMEGFKSYAQDELGMDPDKAQKFATEQFNVVYGRGGYFRYKMGLGAGHDLTGFTPGEKREYDAAMGPLKLQEQMLTRIMNTQMQATLDPTAQAAISEKFLPALMQLESQAQSKYQEILGRRNPKAGATIPDLAGLYKMLGVNIGGAGGPAGGWNPPPGAPPIPPGTPDGTPLHNSRGEVVAIVKNGQYTEPK